MAGDYVAPASDPVGIRIAFPGRRVVGMTVTERSPQVPPSFFVKPGGIRARSAHMPPAWPRVQ
ncbi:hypothetical protein [Streptomyces tendae]|uniref:hypothetical protein n=1 Tax=Streptomyces tendae TaxID=1932 RepID=UPI00368B3EA2